MIQFNDLLAEFGQFLPDATNYQAQLARRIEEPAAASRKPTNLALKMSSTSFNGTAVPSTTTSPVTQPPVKAASTPTPPPSITAVAVAEPTNSQSLKRSPSLTLHPSPSTSAHHPVPAKKQKLSTSYRDVTLAEAAKYGTLTDFAFFDKVSTLL